METEDWAIFILSHGRPECRTFKIFGNASNCYIICDDEDEKLSEYQKRYGERVIVFNRQKYIYSTDWGFNKVKRNHVVFARNAVYDIAKRLGFRYFFVADDDIKRGLAIRYERDGKLKSYLPKDQFKILRGYVDFMRCGRISVLGIAGSGDFIGGLKMIQKKALRIHDTEFLPMRW